MAKCDCPISSCQSPGSPTDLPWCMGYHGYSTSRLVACSVERNSAFLASSLPGNFEFLRSMAAEVSILYIATGVC